MTEQKFRYKFNPYTFARISAMRSLLLKKEDYDKIMKMDTSEIVKFLQEGVYSQEISDAAIRYSGLKLVEVALSRHLQKIFLKLKLISDPSIEFIMNQYLKRYDFYNLKTILRAKQTGAREEEVRDLLLPVGSLRTEKLRQLFGKDTAREIIASSGVVNMKDFSSAINNYEQTHQLSEIENLFDYHYYIDTLQFSEKIPKEGKLFEEFFRHEFDVYNLKLLLRKIFFELPEDYVKKYVIYGGKNISKAALNSLLKAENYSEFMNALSRTKYSRILPDMKGKKGALLRTEIALDSMLLEKSILLFHQHPLTVDIVLGYMFAKEIEVRNLRIIIKSKKLEFTEDYVKDLVMVR